MIDAQLYERINCKVRIVTRVDAVFGGQILLDTIFVFITNYNETLAFRIALPIRNLTS